MLSKKVPLGKKNTWYIIVIMYIHIKVKTGQKREKIEKIKEDGFIVSVKEKPERNLANNRIIELFRTYFKTKNVRIISGVHLPSKLLSID